MRNKIFISFSFLFLHFLFADAQTAYYPDTAWQVKTPAELKMNKLMLDIIKQQSISTRLILEGNKTKRIFVDGGFSKNSIFMNLMAACFPGIEIFAASMAQATAIGAALSIHSSWNNRALPNNIIELKYFAANQDSIVSK